jgi:carboxypeptidase Taq
MARAASESAPVWLEAKATSNFELFLPLLERNLELRHRYVECFGHQDEPYDILLDDFEPEMKTAEVKRIFDEIKPELVQLIADLRDRDVDDSFLEGDFPIDTQIALNHEVVDLFGHRPNTWRIDPTEHPFAAGAGIDDVRITTHYYADHLKSVFSTMHEYGHGLYAHQLPREVAHLPVGQHNSLGIHESQSRLWENLVGRSLPFWRFFYPRLQQVFPDQLRNVDLETFYAGINKVQPSLIRIDADEVTYGMHVILRFELEQDMINGRVELPDLPQRWAEKMKEYLGVDVPDDGRGVLQDMHWSSGLIGYFATYLLGTVMSVQIWEKAAEELGDLEEQVERGEFTPLREWLGLNIHAQGRKYPPQELLRRATGSTIDAKPYLAYLKRKFGAPVAV